MDAAVFYCAIYYGRRTLSLKRRKQGKRHIDDTRNNALCTPYTYTYRAKTVGVYLSPDALKRFHGQSPAVTN